MKFKIVLFAITVIATASTTLLLHAKKHSNTEKETFMPAGEGNEEGEEHEKKKELWWESMHRTAPGADWKHIESLNRDELILQKNNLRALHADAKVLTESFANGKITGTWNERGSANQAGSSIAVDYVPETNMVYTITSSGCLWKGKLDGSRWTVLNDDIIFGNNEVAAFMKPDSVVRILATVDNVLKYSDNDGAIFQKCVGDIGNTSKFFVNQVKRIFVASDAQRSVYAEVYVYDYTTGQNEVVLFKSSDAGKTFSVKDILQTNSANFASAHMAYNSSTVYTVFLSPDYVVTTKVVGSSISKLVANVPGINGPCNLKAVKLNNQFTLYMLINNIDVYRSTNDGASWVKQGSLPFYSWDRFDVSNKNASNLFAGAVDAIRSYNAGVNWNIVNEWYEYYGNVEGKLHADIMEIKHFKKSNGAAFAVINNHGGVAVSYDDLTTTQNITLTGLYNDQYYDVLTNPDKTNQVFGGTQDQGWHLNLTANNSHVLNMTQQISGDYGHLALTQGNKHIWAEYPGGSEYYYNDPTSASLSSTYNLPGTAKPLYGWILATASVAGENSIYIGGGNINGGSGSYLVKLKALTSSPYTISATQFNYDFRANSNGGISAIEASGYDSSHIYVGTEDGSFFYSYSKGQTWNKASFIGPGPWYLYGNSIYASRLKHNLVWYAGSGYSNAGVFESKDGGRTFTAIGNGLPSTLVYEVCANDDETLLFAGTEAGPYVYIRADKKWYSLTGVKTPLQSYTSVQYIASQKIVRFGTFGRGIWDFNIESINASLIAANTTTEQENATASNLKSNYAIILSLYPNPVHDNLNVTVKNYTGITDMVVYDNSGRKMLQRIMPVTNGSAVPVSINNLAAGVYYLSVRINGQVFKQKFVKQ